MPIGPVDTWIAVTLAETVIGRTAFVIYATDRCAKARVLGDLEVQARKHQHLITANLRFAELDALGDEGAIAVADDEADLVGAVGLGSRRQECASHDYRQRKASDHPNKQALVSVAASHFPSPSPTEMVLCGSAAIEHV
jgi:hypothetical protein